MEVKKSTGKKLSQSPRSEGRDSMKWVKDQKVEPFMRKLGIKFEVEKVLVNQIDANEGIKRQARLLNKLNQDHVLSMAIAMQSEESAFPMIILQKPPRGMMWPWSGNHRFASFTTAWPAEETIEVYTCCIVDPVMIDTFPRVINCLESQLGFSKEERIINANWLIENHSYSTKEAAELTGTKPEWLQASRKAEEVKRKITELGINTNGIAKSTLIHMSPLAENINVLRAAANLMCKFDIRGDEALRLIYDVKQGKTEAQQLGEIGRWNDILQSKQKPKKGPKVRTETPIRNRFLKDLGDLAKVLEKYDTLEKLQCTDEGAKGLLHKQWIFILDRMNKIASQK